MIKYIIKSILTFHVCPEVTLLAPIKNFRFKFCISNKKQQLTTTKKRQHSHLLIRKYKNIKINKKIKCKHCNCVCNVMEIQQQKQNRKRRGKQNHRAINAIALFIVCAKTFAGYGNFSDTSSFRIY